MLKLLLLCLFCGPLSAAQTIYVTDAEDGLWSKKVNWMQPPRTGVPKGEGASPSKRGGGPIEKSLRGDGTQSKSRISALPIAQFPTSSTVLFQDGTTHALLLAACFFWCILWRPSPQSSSATGDETQVPRQKCAFNNRTCYPALKRQITRTLAKG